MTLRTNGWLKLVAIFALAMIALAACGGDDDDGGDTARLRAVRGWWRHRWWDLDRSGRSGQLVQPGRDGAPAGEEVTVTFTTRATIPTPSPVKMRVSTPTPSSPGNRRRLPSPCPTPETEFICNIHGAAMSGTLVPE